MSQLVDVSFVIVNYRQYDLLRDCLRSLKCHTRGVRYEIILADNAPDKAALASVGRDFPEIRLVKNRANIGFAAANNDAARLSRGRHLFFLNPDTVFKSDTAANLARFLNGHPDAGAAGCRLENADGSLQFSIRRYPTLGNQLAEALFIHHLWPRSEKTGIVIWDPAKYTTRQPAQWLSGAALLIPKPAFEAVGGFDRNFFLYSEEVDLCFRLNDSGRRVYYVPDTTLVHIGGESGREPRLLAQLVASQILFFRKHYSWSARGGLRAILALRLAARCLVWGIIAVLYARRRPSARRRLSYYRSGLLVALTPRPSPRQVPEA